MDSFKIITPLIYWLLIVVWSYIFIFYIRKLSSKKNSDKFFQLLLLILTIDAFRTLFESAYFGAQFTSFSAIIPISVYDFLILPEIVFIPKLLNLATSLLVLFIIIHKWIPEEENRIDIFNKLLKEKTIALETESVNLKNEAQIAHENELKYSKATNNSPFPIMIHAEDGEVILINRSWTKITGYKLEDINTIQKWTKKAYGEQSETVKEYINELYRRDEANEEGEYTIRTKAGEKRIWAFSSAPLDVLPDGRRMVISSAMDVTERKKAEKKALEREAKLQTTFDAANNVAFILTSYEGKDSKILEFSKGAENIFGYTAKEAIGKPVAMLHAEKDVANFKELQDSINTSQKGISGESMLIRKSGEKFPSLFSLFPVVDEFGKTSSFQGVSIDVSALKTAENSLIESEALLKTTGRVAKVGGWSLDVKTQELKWTEEVYHLHELPLDFVPTEEKAINFYHPDDQAKIAAALKNTIENGVPFNLELRVITAKQNKLWVTTKGNVAKNETHKIIGTFQDITERKLAENEIKNLNNELELRVNTRTNELSNSQAALMNIVEDLNEKSIELEESSHLLEAKNKELETFTYSVSHDLKAPLRGIDGYSKLLQDSYKNRLDGEANIFLSNIRNSALKMNQLINDLLDYSRLERSHLNNEKIQLKTLIISIVSLYQEEIEEHAFELNINVDDQEIITDSKGLTIAVRNMVENAIKFTKKSNKPTISIDVENKDKSLIISVKDNGIGFAMKYNQKIFDIFQRLHRAEDYPGTGIGLALVNKAMQRMNGKVWAESTPNIGSTFFIEIPKS